LDGLGAAVPWGMINYLDRSAIAVAAPFLTKQLSPLEGSALVGYENFVIPLNVPGQTLRPCSKKRFPR
jgi:hypothetical protein